MGWLLWTLNSACEVVYVIVALNTEQCMCYCACDGCFEHWTAHVHLCMWWLLWTLNSACAIVHVMVALNTEQRMCNCACDGCFEHWTAHVMVALNTEQRMCNYACDGWFEHWTAHVKKMVTTKLFKFYIFMLLHYIWFQAEWKNNFTFCMHIFIVL